MTEKEETFMAGGILAVIGLYAIAFPHDFQAGFFLLGIGLAIMASVSEDFRQKFFDCILSIFRSLWDLVSPA